LLTLSLLLQAFAFGQTFSLSGKVFDKQLQPIAFASVQIKELRLGVLTREDGSFSFDLEGGKYDVIVTMVGFEPQLVSISLTQNQEQNFILQEMAKDLGEVVVRVKARDRAEEIIRKLIDKKQDILSAAGPYSCNIYIKAIQIDSFPKKGDTLRARELDQMNMAEISLRLDYASPQDYKEQRLAVTKRGDASRLFYLSATEGDFNLYHNVLRAPGISEIPFISPISYSGLMAYRFRTIRMERRGKERIYTISIKPRQLSNATVEGEIIVSDSMMTVLQSRFELPAFHLPEYDHFEISQQYELVNSTAWMITRQKFRYYSKTPIGKVTGETVAVYRNFELRKSFDRRYFNNEMSVTAREAYEKDSSFWNQVRSEPLTEKEIRFIQYKDSIYHVTHTKAYLDSMDRVINRITWDKVLLWGVVLNNHEKERQWVFSSLTSMFQFLEFGGTRIKIPASYDRIFPSRKRLNVRTDLNYGFRNMDLKGNLAVTHLYNPFSRGEFTISGGRDFAKIFENDAWINNLKRSNIYLNNYFGLYHSVELFNGFELRNGFRIAFRRSVKDYEINPKIDSLFPGWLGDNQVVQFDPYNAAYGSIHFRYTPAQKYIREPKEKIILGSKWPTVFIEWRKGISGLFGSAIDFDYLELGLEQRMKLGTLGTSSYRFKTGQFLNTRDLRLVDYQYQRQGDPFWFRNPERSFQSLDSTFAVFRWHFEFHHVHEFNGVLINKIPFMKKLQLREVAGTGFLVAPERDLRYVEAFAGIERVFKWPFNPLTRFKLGVYIAGSAANKFNNPVQFKVSFTKWDWVRNKWL